MGDESGGESLEEPLEMQSGEELSDSDIESEDFENTNRWLDDLGDEKLDYAPDEGEDDGQGDSEEPEESTAKRPRLQDDALAYGRYRGGPPQLPEGEDQQPPRSGDGEDGAAPREKKKRRRKGKREGRALPMPRPVEMSKAEMEKHRREGLSLIHI